MGVQATGGEPIDLSSNFYFYARILTEISDTHHIPWYAMIIGSSLCVKFLIAPFMIYTAKNAALMNEEEKTVTAIQQSLQNSSKKMDRNEWAAVRQKTTEFYKSKGINPSGNLISMGVVIPV